MPFEVVFQASGSGVSAVVPELNEYGFGVDRPEALEDLRKTLAELYFCLESQAERLSSDLANIWDHMKRRVVRITLPQMDLEQE